MNLKIKKKTKVYIVVFVIFVFILIIGFYYLNNLKNEEISEVCYTERCFNVEIADSFEERQVGLMFRENLAENSGMLFIFEESGVYPFWMKNTLIPLDIIWINKNMKVIYIANAVPCVDDLCINYNPNKNALYVLEVNFDVAKEISLKVGDKIKFK